jgi:hypothetical protein
MILGCALPHGETHGDAGRAEGAVCLRREPELGAVLYGRLPALRRDDMIGTIARSADAIKFNQAYVMCLSQDELLHHIWQLAISLETRL